MRCGMINKDNGTLENILNAGKEEFLEKGFLSSSLRNIVKKANVTTGAFYGYFSNKEALFSGLVEEQAKTVMHMFMEAVVPEIVFQDVLNIFMIILIFLS